MLKKIQNSILFKNTFIYTLLTLINKGIPFLLLPILTHYLTPSDYGQIAIYNTVIAILSIIVGLSVDGAVGTNYFYLEKKKLKKYIGNVFIILTIFSVSVLSILMLFQTVISEQTNLPMEWIYIALGATIAQIITSINLTIWRSQQQAKNFAIYEIAQFTFNISISLVLVIGFQYGWIGRITGISSAIIIFGITSIYILYIRGFLEISFDKEYIRDILKFGIPLIPHNIALWMRSGVDILLITSIVGVSQTGLYSVGYAFGGIVGIFAHAFNNAYSPYLYSQLKDITKEKKIKIVKFTYIYFIGIIVFALLLSFVFSWLIPLFLEESYQDSIKYIIWISLGYAFSGMYLMVVNYIFYIKKTHLLSIITILMSLFHVLLSYMLIKKFGAIGAAYATTISFFLTFVLVWKMSNKEYKMPWGLEYIK